MTRAWVLGMGFERLWVDLDYFHFTMAQSAREYIEGLLIVLDSDRIRYILV